MAVITGDAGDNVLVGSGESDVIEGLGGNDTLSGLGDADRLDGGAGADVLQGGDGDDLLIGGLGNDTLNGGAGVDMVSYWAATGGVTVNLGQQGVAQNTGEGLDTLISIENIEGSAFDDVLTGDDNANQIYEGAGGNDLLAGGGGADVITINRGAHPDSFAFVTVSADGGIGDDIVTLNAFHLDGGRITMNGGDGNDVLSVDGLNLGSLEILMNGGSGADAITVVGGVSTVIHAGDGDDVITLDARGRSSVFLGAGADRIVLTGSPPSSSSPGILLYEFTAGSAGDVIDLSTFLTSAGLTNFPAGSNPFETGHLRITSVNADIVQLEFSADGGASGYSSLVWLEVPATSLTSHNFGGYRPFPAVTGGTAFGDTLQGIDEDDTINGLGGSDTLVGRGGRDTLNGGDGHDVLFGDYYLPDDRANGNDILNGGAGNDTLTGGGGDDFLNGGDGLDILITGRVITDNAYPPYYFTPVFDHSRDGGSDTVDGGAGFDIAHLMYAASTQSVVFDNTNAAAINQITVGGVARGSVTGVEELHVYGGSAGDTLTGGLYSDFLFGNAGDDLLSGGGGGDELEGGDGGDSLSGGAGRDKLVGGSGDDTLNGGAGDDTILGGTGWDTLVLQGTRANYVVLRSGEDFIVKGLDGSDRLSGVEILRFSDGSVIDLARQFELPPADTAGDDPFVLPLFPDDQPLVLPGAEADKFSDDALVLPGVEDPAARLFLGLEARLAMTGGVMPTLDAAGAVIDGPTHRDDGWLL
ncbi:hypothetical protein [Brevundimonas sp.]|uniref:calcium-binding protein n=1 Tax=Brevundimonas sp. TaxID=1871086 RepID=UPI002D6F9DA2|nr:hypothetical protein [Brevundimonas sp.]HYC73495.1 hypothetical protein [Brevundimonas sp.]